MHGAGFQGRAAIATLLIAHGISPFELHRDGHAPMARSCWGAEARHTETVRVFLDAGADSAAMESCLAKTSNSGTRTLVQARLAEAKKEAGTASAGANKDEA